MPQMGESVIEGTITKWLVKEGDAVTLDQPIAAISTDKVDAEIPAPEAGIISQIVAHEGDTVAVGERIAVIAAAGDAGSKKRSAPAAPSAPSAETPPEALTGGADDGVVRQVETSKGEQSEVSTAEAAIAPMAAADSDLADPAETGEGPRRYSPVVLKMAADYGLDLNGIHGTGIGGRVTKRDLLAYVSSQGDEAQAPSRPASASSSAIAAASAITAAQPSVPARPTAAPRAERPPAAPVRPAAAPGPAFRAPLYEPREGDVVEPFSRRRKLIAEHMVYSKTHSPHVGTVAEVDLTRAAALREQHKEAFRRHEGFALTMLPLVAAATVRALKEFPRMNASVVGDSLAIRREINLGIAMDDEEGLLVPVIRSAQNMSVIGLAREIERMRHKIANRQITADDLAGGSFTLSNPGREGNLYGFAIINQPQVGILRMGEIKRRPVIIETEGAEALAIRSMMYLALSYDHRVVDGVLGNRFLYRVARLLEAADFDL